MLHHGKTIHTLCSIYYCVYECNIFQLQNEYLQGVLDGNITEILKTLESQKLDLTDLRIQQGLTADLVADNQIDISGKILSDILKES